MFPFPSIPYRQFNYTFLRNVRLSLTFTGREKNEDKERQGEIFKDYLFRYFSLKIEDKDKLQNLNIRILDENKDLIILFHKDRVDIIMGDSGYTTFTDSFIPVLFRMKSFLYDVVTIESITGIQLTKEDSWEMTLDENEEYSEEEAKSIIFSKEFLKTLEPDSSISDSENIKFYNTIFKDESRQHGYPETIKVNLVCRDNNEKEKDPLITYTQIGNIEDCNIKDFDKLILTIRELNKSLYDCFFWSVSSEIIKIMEEE